MFRLFLSLVLVLSSVPRSSGSPVLSPGFGDETSRQALVGPGLLPYPHTLSVSRRAEAIRAAAIAKGHLSDVSTVEQDRKGLIHGTYTPYAGQPSEFTLQYERVSGLRGRVIKSIEAYFTPWESLKGNVYLLLITSVALFKFSRSPAKVVLLESHADIHGLATPDVVGVADSLRENAAAWMHEILELYFLGKKDSYLTDVLWGHFPEIEKEWVQQKLTAYGADSWRHYSARVVTRMLMREPDDLLLWQIHRMREPFRPEVYRSSVREMVRVLLTPDEMRLILAIYLLLDRDPQVYELFAERKKLDTSYRLMFRGALEAFLAAADDFQRYRKHVHNRFQAGIFLRADQRSYYFEGAQSVLDRLEERYSDIAFWFGDSRTARMVMPIGASYTFTTDEPLVIQVEDHSYELGIDNEGDPYWLDLNSPDLLPEIHDVLSDDSSENDIDTVSFHVLTPVAFIPGKPFFYLRFIPGDGKKFSVWIENTSKTHLVVRYIPSRLDRKNPLGAALLFSSHAAPLLMAWRSYREALAADNIDAIQQAIIEMDDLAGNKIVKEEEILYLRPLTEAVLYLVKQGSTFDLIEKTWEKIVITARNRFLVDHAMVFDGDARQITPEDKHELGRFFDEMAVSAWNALSTVITQRPFDFEVGDEMMEWVLRFPRSLHSARNRWILQTLRSA